MKARHIFKAMAFMLAIPTMLIATACSSDEVVNTEEAPIASPQGYVRHVTVNATRGGDDATRAYYNGKALLFSEGDQIFYGGTNGLSGRYAMLIDWKDKNTFEGNLYTQKEYTGSLATLLEECSGRNYAVFVPAGYEAFGHITINNKDTYNMNVGHDTRHTLAPTKKIAIEQFFGEQASFYDNTNGFQFRATNGVICFTLNGLEPQTTYNLTFRSVTGTKPFDITGTSTSDNSGTLEFAVGTTTYTNYTKYYVIIDDGGKYMDIDLGNKAIQANHIVTVKPITVTAKEVVDLATLLPGSNTIQHGKILTGTAASGVSIEIADGAGVVLRDANISAGISCAGDATIILEGESTVQSAGAGIQAGPTGKTLTIKGNGQLTVTGAANCAAIGTNNGGSCGDITISSGTIIATGGEYAAAIGTGKEGTCGNITIEGGSVDATGGNYGAAIGTGKNGSCGKITITKDVTTIIARKGLGAINSIGKDSESSTIGTVSVGGFTGEKSESPYKYPETHVETWNFYDVKTFNVAAGKDYRGLVVGSTLRSTGISGGTVVAGHMSGTFNFIAPYNRKFTRIAIKGTCNSVTDAGWTQESPGAVWSDTPAQYVHINCDIENIEQIVLTFQ